MTRAAAFISFIFFLMIRRPPRSTLFSLHDALPIYGVEEPELVGLPADGLQVPHQLGPQLVPRLAQLGLGHGRSEEHTSELQSRLHLVCRLLLEKKKKKQSAKHNRMP